jgi:hypothetical protein|tara:strand:+ start:2096 stop:2368 length:273 start_codon:yes stop_codon:yes gene_type:complete
MIKTILNGIWTFSLKKGWDWVWDQTTIDEKAIEVAKETKRRVKAVGEELKDVGEAIAEVADQAGDVAKAAAGKKRPGRKKGSTNKKKKDA